MTIRLGRVGTLALGTAVALAASLLAPASAQTEIARVVDTEAYALSLLNCTRTGGWVTEDGTCLDRGSGEFSAARPALRRHKGISREVAWPWARALVAHQVCGHSISGKPELPKRFSRKGYRYWLIGENVGCGWGHGDPRDVILATHLSMQAEKADKGGHWKNMKYRGYKSVGIGVATGNGVTMVVYDFYGKRY